MSFPWWSMHKVYVVPTISMTGCQLYAIRRLLSRISEKLSQFGAIQPFGADTNRANTTSMLRV
jgi:hypothetical protein